jgi:serine/threonine-protein kinase RsbW
MGRPERAVDGRRDPTLVDEYSASLSGDPAEVRAVRESIRAMAERAGFADRAADIELALDELVANAQEHGAPPIGVRAWADGRLVVEVSDAGGGFDYAGIRRSHPPEQLGRRGRGLWIVRQVVDNLGVRSEPGRTTVQIELCSEPQIGA